MFWSGWIAAFLMATAGPGVPADCGSPFAPVQALADDAIAQGVSQIDDGVIPWDSTVWEQMMLEMAYSGEFFLNNCLNADQPASEQADALEAFAAASLIRPPSEPVDIGGDFGDVTLGPVAEPALDWLDLNGDGVDELILYTQLPYFSDRTVYGLRGALTLAFFDTDARRAGRSGADGAAAGNG